MPEFSIKDTEIINDILIRCEKGKTLFSFSDDQIKEAITQSKKEIHRYELDREIARRKAFKKFPNIVNGMTKGTLKGRCPTTKSLR
jgi:hypothetical protein